MRNLTIRVAAALTSGLCMLPWAGATEQPAIVLESFKVNASNARLEPASKAAPGDVLRYRAVFSGGSQGVRNGQLVLPIPAGTTLQLDHIKPFDSAFGSTDGKTFFRVPLTRTRLVNGKPVSEPVPAGEYRAVRWQLDEVAAGKTAAGEIQVLVNK